MADYIDRFNELIHDVDSGHDSCKNDDSEMNASLSVDTRNKIKREALKKLSTLLTSALKGCSSDYCPLSNFSSSMIIGEITSDEYNEISSIIKKLDCPLDVLNECRILGIDIPCNKNHLCSNNYLCTTQEKMTIQEFIKKDLPFYHITPRTNLECILKDGIRQGANGICVVRSKDNKIINYIASVMLSEKGDKTFSVIELHPTKHGISVSMVAPDSIDEPTAPLHNYLVVNEPIKILKDDVIIESFNVLLDTSFDEKIVNSLEGYQRSPLPILPDCMLND